MLLLPGLWVGNWSEAIAQKYEVKPLKIGRGSEQVFATDFYNGKLFFCSNAKAKHAKHVVNEDNTRFLNLYEISCDEDLTVSRKDKSVILPEQINSKLNEGPISFDRNSQEAFFSSNLATDSTQLSLKLYRSPYDTASGTFSPRSLLDLDLGDGNYSNPTLSADGSQLIFSFTGLTDTTSSLYLSTKTNDSWSTPRPLNSLNTNFNETFPRLCGNTLYFVSDRPNGIGGLDIYSCTFKEGKTGTVRLLPEPVNSKADDFLFFLVTTNEGFFSSNRQGKDRIYKFKQDLPFTSAFVESDLNFCFTFQDEVLLDKTRYDYMWEFGDGTKKNGEVVEHCFQDTGVYEVSCHLMDTETLKIEENIISGVVEVISTLPLIQTEKDNNGQIEVFLEQKWSRNKYTQHYWIVDDEIITDKRIKITAAQSKPITVKAVLWNSDAPEEVVGLNKTITVE